MADKKISELTALTTANDSIEFVINDGGTSKKITRANALGLGDNEKITFGASDDLQIYANAGTSYIKESGTGNLRIQGSDITIQDSDGNGFISCVDGGVGGTIYLKHGGDNKLTTTSTGIDVTGSVTADGLTVDNTGVVGSFGNSVGNNYIDLTRITTGPSYLRLSATTSAAGITGGPRLDFIIADADGTNATERMRIDSTGIDVTGDIDLADNGKIKLGASDDLQIYHDGGHSYISDTGSGNLKIKSGSGFDLQTTTGENYLDAVENGATNLYYDNSKKLATASNGIDVTGNVKTTGQIHLTDTGTLIARPTANAISINTNGSERLRIDSSGRIMFGTSTVSAGLSMVNATSYSNSSTTTWIDIAYIANSNHYTALITTGENGYCQAWQVSGTGAHDTCIATMLGDSGHSHSKDAEFRVSGNYIQQKNISYTTSRQIRVHTLSRS